MEPISGIISAALGYVLKGAAESKTAGAAKEEILGRFWQWIKPKFITDVPAVVETPEAPETEAKAGEKLLELVKDEAFFQELAKRVAELQQNGVKAKNIVRGDIVRVKKIRIGDKEYSPDDAYDFKNIVGGNVDDADEFILGDGH